MSKFHDITEWMISWLPTPKIRWVVGEMHWPMTYPEIHPHSQQYSNTHRETAWHWRRDANIAIYHVDKY